MLYESMESTNLVSHEPPKHDNLPSSLRMKTGEKCRILLFLVVHLLICKSFTFYNHFLFSPTWRIRFLYFISFSNVTMFTMSKLIFPNILQGDETFLPYPILIIPHPPVFLQTYRQPHSLSLTSRTHYSSSLDPGFPTLISVHRYLCLFFLNWSYSSVSLFIFRIAYCKRYWRTRHWRTENFSSWPMSLFSIDFSSHPLLNMS